MREQMCGLAELGYSETVQETRFRPSEVWVPLAESPAASSVKSAVLILSNFVLIFAKYWFRYIFLLICI